MALVKLTKRVGDVCVIDIKVAPLDCENVHDDLESWLYPEFGDMVRRRRQELGMSQAEVARQMGLTRASVSNLEAGRQRPVLHQLYLLASILRTPLDALLPHGEPDTERRHHDLIERQLLEAAARVS